MGTNVQIGKKTTYYRIIKRFTIELNLILKEDTYPLGSHNEEKLSRIKFMPLKKTQLSVI